MKNIAISNLTIAALCALSAVFVLSLDLMVPLGVDIQILYVSVVFISLLSANLKYALFAAGASSVLIIIGFFLSPGDSSVFWQAVMNRYISLFAVWIAAILGYQYKKGQESIWYLASIVDSSQNAIIGKDIRGTIKSWNKGSEELFGYKAEEMLGKSIKKIIPEDRYEEEKDIFKLAFEEGGLTNFETIRVKKDKTQINVSLTASPIKDRLGQIMGLSVIVHDITQSKKIEGEKEKYRQELETEVEEQSITLFERNKLLEEAIAKHKETEIELRQYQKQLRNLSAHAHKVRERERASMAREVHDELGQLLTAIKMDLAWVQEDVPEENAKVQDRLEETQKLVDSTIKSVQKVVSQLRPGILDDLGIVEAIKWYTKEFQERFELDCDLQIASDEIELDKDRSIVLYRIFQESLTNVARHAKAQKVDIKLNSDQTNLYLTIKDNGRGIDDKELKDSQSYGLMGMQERVRLFDGKVKIIGSEGQGTVVDICLPIN